MKIHIVQKGDTLWKIAKKYGVNFEELKKMNSQLSNPDMIMPGMKIKVPTTGGTIKKEAPYGGAPGTKISMGTKKEMPIKEQPFVKEKPMQMPIKEAPIAMPIKEAPKKEMPIKEAPIAPYVPKMPQPIIPEIDINNYYMMNMANIQQPPPPPPQPQLPPKPVNILPVVKEECPEVPVQMPIQGGCEQPMYPCPPYIYPISPVLPGSGLPCPPYPQGAPYPPVQGPMPGYYGMPGVEGSAFVPHVHDESSSFMPNAPVQGFPEAQGFQTPGGYPAYPQAAPFAQVPYGYPSYPQGPTVPVSPVLPGSGVPYGQIPYGQTPYGYGYPERMYPQMQGQTPVFPQYQAESADMMPYQQTQGLPTQYTTPPPFAGKADCGCGGPKAYVSGGVPYQGIPQFVQGTTPYPQGLNPYPLGVAPGQNPYPQGISPAQPGTSFYPQGGVPYPQANVPIETGGTPYPQWSPALEQGGVPIQQGMMPPGYPLPQGQIYSPPYGQQGLYMSPYGTGQGQMGGSPTSMPRQSDESSEYEA